MESTNEKGKRCSCDEVPHSGLWGFPTTSSVCSQQESQCHAIGCLVADYSECKPVRITQQILLKF